MDGSVTLGESTVANVEIVLIRHGQPEWVRDGLNVADPPLTELGRRQADWMAQALAGEHFDEVLVSPLTRARQTAEPLLRALGRDEAVEPWLEEIRDPDWHGTPAEHSEALYRELKERPVDDRWHGLVGGESAREFNERIHAGAAAFLEARGAARVEHEIAHWKIADPGLRIALVAHGGTNAVTIGHLLGFEPTPWEWERFLLGHASVTRLVAVPVHGGFTFSLKSLSNLEHVPPQHRTH